MTDEDEAANERAEEMADALVEALPDVFAAVKVLQERAREDPTIIPTVAQPMPCPLNDAEILEGLATGRSQEWWRANGITLSVAFGAFARTIRQLQRKL
jgi:hypothetical protein